MERIVQLENEISKLRETLQNKEQELYNVKKHWNLMNNANINSNANQQSPQENGKCINKTEMGNKLPKWAIERYSRQILLPNIGVAGQERLCAAKVLIVGAGGLGSPAAMYLAGAGVGEIGLVDYDVVDLTNIHRQIMHGESDQGVTKVKSAAHTLRNINSRIKVTTYKLQLDSSNALETVSKYDVVLDCTDNVPTRYLLNDACVLAKVPLISGSALKMDGQITIYGYRAERNQQEKDPRYVGPCYRCLFPTPPPAETVGSCSANGVAGPVPGVIGTLQALEAMKYIVGSTHQKLLVERMLLFDGDDMTFRIVRLRAKREQCDICSDTPSITHLVDYEQFCQARASEKIKKEARLKSERRKREREKRMNGQSYLGVRKSRLPDVEKMMWIQDVPKSERRLGSPCKSVYCAKGTARQCPMFTEEKRQEIFARFWNELDWRGKRKYVRSLVDSVPPKRRRSKHKGDVSRKGDSKLYHLIDTDGEKRPVCRVTFLNTLGIKEGTVRCWLVSSDRKKPTKIPIKALNVESFIDALPKTPPKCVYCYNSTTLKYIDLENINNQYQLYKYYVKEMRERGVPPASRKTFSKVCVAKDIRVFKPKNETDTCDLTNRHNVTSLTANPDEVHGNDSNLEPALNSNYVDNCHW